MVILAAIFALLVVSASAAESFSNKSSVDCGGLFFLQLGEKQFSARGCNENASIGINNLTLYGGLAHYRIMGRYTDEWDVKGVNDLKFGNAGFESRFKYTTLGVDISSLPFIRSKIEIHHPDSLFFFGASIMRGEPEIGNIRWISENKSDLVHEISVDWQTHFLYRHFDAGSKIANHQFGIFAGFFETSPENPSKEYYVRDSVQAIILGGNYKGNFAKDSVEARYIFADADIYLYGIMQQEESRKRFMYIPLNAQLHFAEAKWKRKYLQAHLDFAYATAQMDANPDRFFETLAPNRALPTSVLKALSFSFLKKNFRVDADIDAMGIFGGATLQWPIGHQLTFTPKINIDGYYAQGEADIRKKTENTVIISTQSYIEEFTRKLSSFGSVLTLGSELSLWKNLSIDYSVTQLIPFHISYREIRPGEVKEKEEDERSHGGLHGPRLFEQEKTKGDVESTASAAFRNGFATSLSVVYRM